MSQFMYPYKHYNSPNPKIISGKGIWLYDKNGKGYVDSTSGPMTVNLWHSNEYIIQKISSQLGKLHFTYRHHFRCNETEDLASKLVSLSSGRMSHAFFLNGGSEASEAAYRLTLDYWRSKGRNEKVIALGRSVTNHGNTVTSLAYGDDYNRKKSLVGKVIDETTLNYKLPACYCRHCPVQKHPDSCQLECVKASLAIIDDLGPERISCVFIEPITASSGGALVPHPRYLTQFYSELRKREILLVADEIVTGLGRTGSWYCIEEAGDGADIIVLGKGLGAGYTPISGVLINENIASSLSNNAPPHTIGHSYSGNPLSCHIALNVINYIEDVIGLPKIHEKGIYFRRQLDSMHQQFEFIVDIRSKGLLLAVETRLSVKLASEACRIGYDLGINIYPCRSSGDNGNRLTILFAPPLTITIEEIDIVVERFDTFLSKINPNE